MKRFNSNTVRASKHLLAKTDKEKARLRAFKGVKSRWAQDREVKPSDTSEVKAFIAPMKENFTPRGFGRKVKGLSPAKRALVAQRQDQRREFFASMGVLV